MLSKRDLLRGAGGAAAAWVLPDGARAAETERPPSFNPGKIPGIKPTGANYSIVNPVRSDGFLRVYGFKTPYGDFTVSSDAMAQIRIRELAAVLELDKLTQSQAFNNALTQAGLAPVNYAGKMIQNPFQTLGDTLGGIGNTLSQVGSGLYNAKSRDTPLGGLGADQKRRELAAKLMVDPYTDFEPLAVRLAKLSEAAAAGGLVVSAALMVIPGAAGMVISNVATGSKVVDAVRDYSAAQLMDMNRIKFLAMGLDRPTADALLTNHAYTPLDVTAIATSLETVPVQGRTDFLRRAAAVKKRDAAFFNRRYALLIADYHARTGSVVSFVSLGEFPFNQTRTGGLVGIWPVDAVSWTEGTSGAMRNAAGAIRQGGFARPQLRIAGQATARAKQGLGELGMSVVENARN
ncbi:MAG: hypothetical protein AB7K35_05020 [Pseudorhodoplanes sp.]